jgi:AAA family ATP:ADP antiporter
MPNRLFARIEYLWGIKPEFRSKVFFLALTYFLFICCQATWRPLKLSIFSKIVGAEYTPDAKLMTLVFLIPLLLFYSYLIDVIRRHHIIYCFTIFHGIGGIIFYFLLSNPAYGIANTAQSSSRLVGWCFYFLMESFTAFLSTIFWSFANSINNPKDAKNYYGIFVAGSKMGGIFGSSLLYFSITLTTIPDAVLLPKYLLFGSFALFAAAVTTYFLMKKVPGYYMHGYEAAYQVEKKRAKKEKISFWESVKRSTDGLFLVIKNPYVLGIFVIVIFYDIMVAIFDYRVLRLADVTYKTAGSLAAYWALYYMFMNMIGVVISLFGTTPMQRILGLRISLFVFPLLCGILLIISYFFPFAGVLFVILVLMRALNYGLNHPTREVLYVPTTKDIKFKAKAWTEAYGSRVAKGTGSVFNKITNVMTPSFAIIASTSFNLSLVVIWLIVVYFLGKTLQESIDTKTVIGYEGDETEDSKTKQTA